MNETESPAAEELDLNALADLWMGSPDSSAPQGESEPEHPEGEGGAEPEAPEAPNGSPTQQATVTPEMEEEIYQRRLNSQLARARAAKEEKDLQNLLTNGSDEDIAKFTREQIAAAQEQQRVEAIESQAAGRTAVQMIEHLLSDEFIESLTPEEAQALLPVEQGGQGQYAADRDFVRAIEAVKTSKARSGLFTQEDVERLVQERIKGAQNVQRGNQFSQSSPTMTPPATATDDRHAGKEGQELKDSLWQHAMESWDRPSE